MMVLAVGIEPTSPPYEGVALPLSYASLEPQVGIEPNSPAYKAGASPQCFPRQIAVKAFGIGQSGFAFALHKGLSPCLQ